MWPFASAYDDCVVLVLKVHRAVYLKQAPPRGSGAGLEDGVRHEARRRGGGGGGGEPGQDGGKEERQELTDQRHRSLLLLLLNRKRVSLLGAGGRNSWL